MTLDAGLLDLVIDLRETFLAGFAVFLRVGAAMALLPAFGEAELLETGADARPAFPDNLPRLRRVGATLHANGLYRHGFLLAPAVAAMAADHLEHGIIPEFMDPETMPTVKAEAPL